MTDVWLFGEFYCVSQLNSFDTKDRKKAKWRSQIKVPQGSVIQRNGNILFLEFNNALVSYPVYLTDLEYQLRDTGSKPNSRRPIYSKNFSPNVNSTYLWFQRVSTTEYQEYGSPVNPPQSSYSNPFEKPIPTPKPLIDLGYLNFSEERLELGFDYGAVGGMAFETEIIEVASGKEQRNALRHLPLGRWQLGDRTLLESEVEAIKEVSYLKDFHTARLGSYEGFRFKDWSDYQAFSQLIGDGDGIKTQFQLHKAYGVGSALCYRPITKPIASTFLSAFVNSPPGLAIAVTLDSTTGIVTLDPPLPAGTLFFASFEFDVPVWFESDQIGFKLEGYDEETQEAIYQLESLFVVEGRIPVDNWIAEPNAQIDSPLDLGIIYETVEQYDFSTVKQELKSGYVKRDSKRLDSRTFINLGTRKYSKLELEQILRYFWLARGQLNPFPLRNLNKIYTVRFDQDQLSFKFEAASKDEEGNIEETLFSLPGLKLQVFPNLGLFKYLDADTYLYFAVDTSGTIDDYLPSIYDSFYDFQQNLINLYGADYSYKSDIFGFSDERWLTVPVDNPQPKAVYVIFSCEAAAVYHSTLTFTPATATFNADVTSYINDFATRDFCKVIVVSLSAHGAAYDIFNGQLFAAAEGLLGYSPALKDYGLEIELDIDPSTSVSEWLDYFRTGNIAIGFSERIVV
jgi:uncharacterized protein (TIGR02217 family)